MTVWPQPFLPALGDNQFADWQRLVEERTGIDYSQHRSILQSGLCQRLRELGRSDYDQYLAEILQLPEGFGEWQMLLAALTVRETSFFRQPAAFDLVRGYLRKRMQGQSVESCALDLWSVGCATGEEAYSLAITASEALAVSGKPAYFGVLATDICPQALTAARTGIYSKRRGENLSDSLRRRHFTVIKEPEADEPSFQINAGLRARVGFNTGNLLHIDRMAPLPMDVIFCQNVLVYFRRWRSKQVLDALAARLKPGGLLVLGPGEAPQWQHPQLLRAQYAGVTAWLKRTDTTQTATAPNNEEVPL